MKSSVFIGVDLGTSLSRKSTGLAYLTEQNGKPRLVSLPLHIISDDIFIRSSIILISKSFSSIIVAIDAPLSWPKYGTMRECEKRLCKHGMPCFPSGAEWVRTWVEKAIGLRKWAENELGAKVIEVYPYAARVTLGIGVKKKTKRGRHIIQKRLFELINGMSEDKLLSQDELDAILSAYTAYLEGNGNAIKMDGVDGRIYLPSKMDDHKIYEYQK